MPKVNKITAKQKEFVKHYVQGDNKTRGNGTQSALKVYNVKSPNVASAVAVETLQKPLVKSEIARLMDENGMSLDDLQVTHSEGLQATKLHNSDKDTIEVPDYSVRHKYLDTAYRLHNLLVNNDTHDKSVNVAFIINDDSKRGGGK